MTPTDLEVAWFAGVFEGEGCIVITSHSVRLVVKMTDEDIVRRIDRAFPSTNGVRVRLQRAAHHKVQFEWSVGSKSVVLDVLGLILPYLGHRRGARAREAIAFLATRPGEGARCRNKTHCPKGHPYSGENLMRVTRKDGGPRRRCKTCEREWHRRWKQRQSAIAADPSSQD